jgi:hypothetical protein
MTLLGKPESLLESYPQKGPEDQAYDAARLALSVFPLGGTTAEILSLVLAQPLTRRRDEWFQVCAEVIDDIRARTEGFDFATLQANEQFISATIAATRIAAGTHSREKREMLRNILVKIGTSCDVDEDLQFLYLRLVEDLTPTHVKILEFFWRGNSRIVAVNGGVLPPSNHYEEFAYKLMPELAPKGPFVEQIIQDLRSRGLCNAQGLTSGMGGQVMTNQGIGFLMFIMAPEEKL